MDFWEKYAQYYTSVYTSVVTSAGSCCLPYVFWCTKTAVFLTTASASSMYALIAGDDHTTEGNLTMLMEHQISSHTTEPVLNRQGMASTAVMIFLALNKYLLKEAWHLCGTDLRLHSTAQANCVLFASGKAFGTEYDDSG